MFNYKNQRSKNHVFIIFLLVNRIQFYAIELIRNKRGMNKFHSNNTEILSEKIDNLNTSDEGER